MRISDWSSDVCSSDLVGSSLLSVVVAYLIAGVVQRLMHRLRSDAEAKLHALPLSHIDQQARGDLLSRVTNDLDNLAQSLQQTMSQMLTRSEEHTSDLQSLMRISYAVYCLKKKNATQTYK